jgi:hypothetical protein
LNKRPNELIQKAMALKTNTSEKEKAYINALSVRYTGAETPDRTALDQAYAEAMRELHHRYPEDLDAATLYAEAVMDLRPWSLTASRFMGDTQTTMAALELAVSGTR